MALEGFSSSVTTIPVGIIEKLVNSNRHDHVPISRIAKIVNRSIPDTACNRSEYFKRGQMLQSNPHSTSWVKLSDFNIEDSLIGKVSLDNLIVPGSSRLTGDIDMGYEQFKKNGYRDLDSVIRIASLVAVLYGSMHPFGDANGRTAVALADYTIRRYGEDSAKKYRIDMEKFKSTPHSSYMVLGGLSFAPLGCDIDTYLQESNFFPNIDLISTLKSKRNISQYIKIFERNMLKVINETDWRVGFVNLTKREFQSISWLNLSLRTFGEYIRQSLDGV